MYKQKIKAFTLVELIVVITILAILGTIAFISLSGYSEDARDSTRITDMSSMKSSLELFQLDAGKYPAPTNGINVTYSGSTVWSQGTFGETVYANVSKLDKIPTDPITNKQYTYSVTSNNYEYQLGGIVEGETISMNNEKGIMNNVASSPMIRGKLRGVSAGTVTAKAYVTGNYNGLMTKTITGTTCNVLSIPSIIVNDTSSGTDLQQIVTNKSFVYRGYNNLPSSSKGSKYKIDGGFDFTPTNLIAYTDTGSCANITSSTSSGTTARVNLIKGLQTSYSGSLLINEGEIKNIVDLTIDTNNPSTDVLNYASNFVNNVFGTNIVASNNSTVTSTLQHLTSITSLASIPEENKATFSLVGSDITGNASYLFDNSITNPPYAVYWWYPYFYVEIEVQQDFRIWSVVSTTSDYYSYDATLKFINSNTLAEVPNTQSDTGRPNDGLFHIASSTIPAGRYKVYTQLNSTRNSNQYRLDDEWFIEKMN